MPELTKDARMLDGNVLEDEYSHSPLGPCRGLIPSRKVITESTVGRPLAGGAADAQPIGKAAAVTLCPVFPHCSSRARLFASSARSPRRLPRLWQPWSRSRRQTFR